MSDYPRRGAERRKLRRDYISDALWWALQKVNAEMRSLQCGGFPYGTPEHGKCTNDGATCLCECHDKDSTDE